MKVDFGRSVLKQQQKSIPVPNCTFESVFGSRKFKSGYTITKAP
jgi:hypothetical protein